MKYCPIDHVAYLPMLRLSNTSQTASNVPFGLLPMFPLAYFQMLYFQFLLIYFQVLSKDLKDKVAVSLLRRQFRLNEWNENLVKRATYLSLTLRKQTPPNSVNYDSCEWLFWITAMKYCEGLLWKLAARLDASKSCVWCNRSFKVSVGTKVSFQDLALKRYK